jgi:serine/threonine protein kinase
MQRIEPSDPVADANLTQGSIIRRPNLAENMNIVPSSIHIDNEIGASCKLGKLFKGSYFGQIVAVRKIAFSRVSSYVVENYIDEIERFRNLVVAHLLPIIGGYSEQNTICVVMPYMENGSLFDAIHTTKKEFSVGQLAKIMIDIARCMKDLHLQGRIHGNLNSQNILFDGNWR